MYINVHINTSGRRYGRGRLPISQYFVWVGPIVIHIAWGESAKLIKELKDK